MGVAIRIRGSGLTMLAIGGVAVVLAAMGSMVLRGRPAGVGYELFMFQNGPSAIVLLWLGWLVLRRQPWHGAGLVLLVIGLVQVVHVAIAALVDARLVAAGVDLARVPTAMVVPAALPADAAIPLLLMSTVWVPAPVLAVTLLPLVFPDGRLPGRRWGPVVALAAAGTSVLVVAFAIDAWPTAGWADEPPPVVGALIAAGGLPVLAAAAASVAALVRRWRRAAPGQRWQFRTIGSAAVVFAVVATVTYPWQPVWIPAILVTFHVLLVAYALAVARYRLHDLEPVIGRTAVGTILAVMVAGVYLVIVVGVGSLVGRGVEGTLLPLVAVGVVALLVEPARRRARRLVDRLLYRRHADRTEVLSRLAERASASASEEILGEVADLLVRSTGASRAEVWLDVERQPQLAGAAGASDHVVPTLQAAVVHQDERLGELRLYARAARDLVPDVGQLLDDVAHSLGVVLRNARLTTQLRAQLDELQRSRQRLVEAHDQARRGLERDIHDGAQARLISLRLRLGVARALADDVDSDALRVQLDQLGDEVDAAVRSLRELARGLHPPILEQSGLASALRAHVRDLPLAVSVDADGIGRYDRAVEGAVYFACLEAVQNALRHGGAQRVVVSLAADGDGLRFCVNDDGSGFDLDLVVAGAGLANIDDRVSALGGHTWIDTAPGEGTRITGEIPAQTAVDDR